MLVSVSLANVIGVNSDPGCFHVQQLSLLYCNVQLRVTLLILV